MPLPAEECDDGDRSMLLSVRFWARMVAINAFAAALAVVAFGGATSHEPWRGIVKGAAVSFTFSTSISPFCVAVMTGMAGPMMRRHSAPVAWTIIAAALAAIALAGTLFASGILVAVGYVTPGQYWML